MVNFWDLLEKVENVGYKTANVVHKTTVLGLVGLSVWGTYALLRDFRTYFLMRRDPKYAESLKQREEAIRKLVEK